MTVYAFAEKLAEGECHEDVLDSYFSKFYAVKAVSPVLQRLGVDRVFTCKKTRARWLVEYKADEVAPRTRNAFIEVVSVDKEDKPGWALTSCAQLLVYYIPAWQRAYIVSMPAVKWALERWDLEYETKDVRNQTYRTWGIVVPLKELEALSKCVVNINGG